MDVTVRVDVATARPPRDHDFVCVTVSVECNDPEDIDRACVEARLIAAQMACCHPHVVMPTRATVLSITNV